MKVLRAIGNFFVKIWKWIMKTAWIQPLLIVGILFGVIFSIPPIVEAIRNIDNTTNPLEFLENESFSFEGITRTGGTSDVEKFTRALSAAIEDPEKGVVGYEQKFYLTFSQEGCSGCADVSKSISKLNELWNKGANGINTTVANEKFKLYNIECDTKLDNAKPSDLIDIGVTNDKLIAFNTLVLNGTGLDVIIQNAAAVGENSDFRYFGVNDSASYVNSLNNLETSLGGGESITDFHTPVVIVFDFTSEGLKYSGNGIREIFFGVQKAREYQTVTDNAGVIRGQAQFLMDAWNGAGAFVRTVN